MSLLKTVDRAAKTAWCPLRSHPHLLATGSITSTINSTTFDSTATLEIYDLNLGSLHPNDMRQVGSIDVKDCFSSIAWGRKGEGEGRTYPYGLIAGGMTDGSIHLFDPNVILQQHSTTTSSTHPKGSVAKQPPTHQQASPIISRTERHRGDVLALDWSPLEANLLASSGSDGEVLTWDVANPSTPVAMSPSESQKSGQVPITALAWNQKLVPILAAGTEQGDTIVYDLRQKREKVRVRNSMRTSIRTQSIKWSPDNPVTFAVCYATSPVVELWDVRSTLQPKARLEGIHQGHGVLSIDWSLQDSALLLSSGDDGRIVAWDTNTGTHLTDYNPTPETQTQHFDIQIHPHLPNLVSSSSYDSKVSVFSLPHTGLNHVPKWMKRPTGAAFGFGGRLVEFHHVDPPAPLAGSGRNSVPGGQSQAGTRPPSPNRQASYQQQLQASQQPPSITLSQLISDHNLLAQSEHLQSILRDQRYTEYCTEKATTAPTEEDRTTWKVMRILFEDEVQQKALLLKELGFEAPVGSQAANVIETAQAAEAQKQFEAQPLPNEDDFFSAEIDTPPAVGNADDPSTPPAINGTSTGGSSAAHNQAMNGVASQLHKSLTLQPDATFNETPDDQTIKQALVFGDFKTAVDKCIAIDRMADALVIASFSAETDLWRQTRDLYFTQHKNPFIRSVMKSVVSQDLQQVVETTDVSQWQQTLAVLITYSSPPQQRQLVDLLGSKLESVPSNTNIGAATICYMCSANLDRLIEIWSRHSHGVQDAIEKISLFANAAQRKVAPGSSQLLSGKLSEYAGLLATQGGLHDAWSYLIAVSNVNIPAASGAITDDTSGPLLDRIFNATSSGYNKQQAPPFPFASVQVNVDPKLKQTAYQYDQLKQQKAMQAMKGQAPQLQQPHATHPQQPSHPQGAPQSTPYNANQGRSFAPNGGPYGGQAQPQQPYGAGAQSHPQQPPYGQPPHQQAGGQHPPYGQSQQPAYGLHQQPHAQPFGGQQHQPQQQPPFGQPQHGYPPQQTRPITPRSSMGGPGSQPQQPSQFPPSQQPLPHHQQQYPPQQPHQNGPATGMGQPGNYGQQQMQQPLSQFQQPPPPQQTQPYPPQQTQQPPQQPSYQQPPPAQQYGQQPATQSFPPQGQLPPMAATPHQAPPPQQPAQRFPSQPPAQPSFGGSTGGVNPAQSAHAPPTTARPNVLQPSIPSVGGGALGGGAASPNPSIGSNSMTSPAAAAAAPVNLTAEQHHQMSALHNTVQRLLATPTLKPADQKKLNDISTKLKILEQKLGTGQLSASAQREFHTLTTAVSNGDWVTAQATHMKLVQSEWSGNDQWLLALKTLLMLAKKEFAS